MRPTVLETTALGAAYLAGLATGFWKNMDEIKSQWKEDRTFKSKIRTNKRNEMLSEWSRAVDRSRNWVKE